MRTAIAQALLAGVAALALAEPARTQELKGVALSERVKELGGQVLHGPMEVPGGNVIVTCLDPKGALFALYSTGEGEGS